MSGKLEVSFNSPQCGWMSIGFEDGVDEFHTTTAYMPHATALSDLLRGLTSLLDTARPAGTFTIPWSRNPEEFDLQFFRDGDTVLMEVYEYPSGRRTENERELAFAHTGKVADIVNAFEATFDQLYADRDTDEFEFNWRQPFPFEEFEEFKRKMDPAIAG